MKSKSTQVKYLHWSSSETPSKFAFQRTARDRTFCVSVFDVMSFVYLRVLLQKSGRSAIEPHTEHDAEPLHSEQRIL